MDIEKLLAATVDGGFTTSPDGRIGHWNRGAERILGYTAREAVGRPCRDLLVGADGTGEACARRCHVAGPATPGEAHHSFNLQTRTKAGAPIWVHVDALTVPNGRPASGLTVHLFQDVTAIREILALVREECAGSPPAAPAAALTPRELEILKMVATGVSTKGVAEGLHVSPATVRNHVQSILGKLGAHSRLQAVAHATRRRLL
jgi:PAS domain S-box-containing protein